MDNRRFPDARFSGNYGIAASENTFGQLVDNLINLKSRGKRPLDHFLSQVPLCPFINDFMGVLLFAHTGFQLQKVETRSHGAVVL